MAFKNNSCSLLLSSKMPSFIPTSDFSMLDPWPGQKHRFWLRYPEWSLSSVTNQLYDWKASYYSSVCTDLLICKIRAKNSYFMGLGDSVVKNPPAITRDTGRGFHPWVGKIPWRRKWQPTPVFLPGESHGQRSLAGYRRWGHKETRLSTHTHSYFIELLEWLKWECI